MLAASLLAIGLMQSSVGMTGEAQSATASQISVVTLSSADVSQLKTKAETGDVEAQVKLAEAYQDGNGVSQNDGLAARWYRRAAEQANPAAQNALGNMYRVGSGVEKNKEEAVNWYRKAARQKYAAAMFNLGTVYYNGDGVETNYVLANAWFLLAQERGSPPADDAVVRMATSLSRDEVLETYLKLAEMLNKGDELPRDDRGASEWYRRAADKGDAFATVELAQRLIQGIGAPPDYLEARRRCEYAAKVHFGPGAYSFGLMNKEGLGGPKNLGEAVKWFARAADLRDDRATLLLGEMYWKGEGVKQDKETAYMWLWIAANSGVQGAPQDQQQIKQEMDAKEVTKATQKAVDWLKLHPNRQPTLRRPLGSH
jgi:TPR repeat protein